ARCAVRGRLGTPPADPDREAAQGPDGRGTAHAPVPVRFHAGPGRARTALAGARAVSVAASMAGKRVGICTGSRGVGRTGAAAAGALGLAAQGRRVAVVTIDPARRLASSLGLEQLDNVPRLIEPGHFARQGIELRGELWAMMLDAKRTFDELIQLLAPDA